MGPSLMGPGIRGWVGVQSIGQRLVEARKGHRDRGKSGWEGSLGDRASLLQPKRERTGTGLGGKVPPLPCPAALLVQCRCSKLLSDGEATLYPRTGYLASLCGHRYACWRRHIVGQP